MNDPFTILTKIWAYKSVISDLEKVRINPNLIHTKQTQNLNSIVIRNDLEFYIPQLCSFVLFGDNIVIDELLSFLCNACYASFFFAHRVIWFLKSMIFHNKESEKINLKINNILHVLQTIYKTDNKRNNQTKINNFVIAGSSQYIECINNFNKERESYPYITSSDSDKNKERTSSTNLKELDMSKLNGTSSLLKLNIFYYNNNNDESKQKNNTNFIGQIDKNDINLTAFLSTINFFDHLTNISEKIRFLSKQEERENVLEKKLNKLNEKLPFNVYIPFNNKQIRNYVIGKFNIKYSKVIKTKERAPILLTAECFRLEELCYEKLGKKSLESNKFSIKEIKESLRGSLLSNNENEIEIDLSNCNKRYQMNEINKE